MTRDMDLIRRILLKLEADPEALGWAELGIEDHPPETVSYHVKLLAQAGLIEAQDLSTHSGLDWRANSLTWSGHEFLDTVRNENVWRQTTALIREKTGSASLEVVKAVAVKIASSLLGL